MPGIEANDGQAVLAQLKGQLVRHLASLQAYEHGRRGVCADRLADSFWLGAAFAPPNDRAGLIDDADRGGLKRDIKADVVLLIHGNAAGGWLPAEANWAFGSVLPPRLRHVPKPLTPPRYNPNCGQANGGGSRCRLYCEPVTECSHSYPAMRSANCNRRKDIHRMNNYQTTGVGWMTLCKPTPTPTTALDVAIRSAGTRLI